MSTVKSELRYDPHPSLGIVDDVPIPSGEILEYAKDNDTLRFKGLALHDLTTMVVANALMDEISTANKKKPSEERFDVNPDLVFETMIAYHAPRGMAEDGQRGESSDAINNYMKDHDDIELATLVGAVEHLPVSVIQQMEHFQARRGFPEKTIGPENPYRPETIDWNSAVAVLSSFLVAGTIQPLDSRFEDLINRHASNPDSPKKLSEEQLLRYKEWAKDRVADLSRHIGIEPNHFLDFLRRKVFGEVSDAKHKSNDLVRQLLGREPREEEFLPVSPAYKYLSTSIMGIDDPSKMAEVQRMMEKPDVFLRAARRYGLISPEIDGKFTSKISV